MPGVLPAAECRTTRARERDRNGAMWGLGGRLSGCLFLYRSNPSSTNSCPIPKSRRSNLRRSNPLGEGFLGGLLQNYRLDGKAFLFFQATSLPTFPANFWEISPHFLTFSPTRTRFKKKTPKRSRMLDRRINNRKREKNSRPRYLLDIPSTCSTQISGTVWYFGTIPRKSDIFSWH